MVHEVAASGFADAADYEAARPSYPDDAVAWFVERLDIRPGRRVCDLAAGTGKLTRLLVPTGAEFVAVEPVAGMREILRARVPQVPVVAATAEALPFAPSSLDAVVVAQAWHWFDHEVAVKQLREALRIGGRLGLVWNARDRSEPWVYAVWSVMDRVENACAGRFAQRNNSTFKPLVLQIRVAENLLQILEVKAIPLARQAQIHSHLGSMPAMELMPASLPLFPKLRLFAFLRCQQRDQPRGKCLG